MNVRTARAWLLEGPNRFHLEPVALEPLRPGWLRCRVRRFQPSITDVMRFRGLGDAAEYRRGRRFIGHEFVAEVAELSTNAGEAEHALLGRRVVCLPRNPCGTCAECRRGHPYLCERPVSLGSDGPGAMSEIIDLPAAFVHVVPDAVSDLAACCSQPAASAVAHIAHAGVAAGARIAILGQGIMGLLLLQAARVHGASAVITTAPREPVRRLSLDLGADESLAPDAADTPAKLREFVPDIVIDAAGGPPLVGLSGTGTFELALHCVRRFGTVLALSDITTPMTIPTEHARRGIRVVFGHMGYWYYGLYPHTFRLLADGRLRCDRIVTHELRGISRLPEALDLMARRRETGALQAQIVVYPAD